MLAALPLVWPPEAVHVFQGAYSTVRGARQITGAIVTVVTTPTGYISSVVTDKSGNFSFALIAGLASAISG